MSQDSASPRVEGLGRGRSAAGWLLALAGAPALTVLLVPLRDGGSPPTYQAPTYQALLFLALVVGCALLGGRWPAVVSALLGFALLNWYFTAPQGTLAISDSSDVVALVVFVVVALAVAAVVDAASRRRRQAVAARAEAALLSMLSTTVLGGEYDVPRLLGLVRDTFAAESAVLHDTERLGPAPVGPSDSSATASPTSVLLLRGRVLGDSDRRVLAAFARHLAVLGEREELARQTRAAAELEAGNRTRTALLAAVSHDLRTPLAGIRAAAETLQRGGDALSAEDRATLLETVTGSTERLTSIVTDLLDMSRLQTGAVRPTLEEVALADVVADAVSGSGGVHGAVVVERPMPVLVTDAGLLRRVVENLVSNAVRHTPAGTTVQVSAQPRGARVRLLVADHGPGVPPDQRGRMFEPFQRLGDAPSGEGVGLGLAVARGLTEALGGELEVHDTPGGGLTMVVDLPGGA